MKFEKKNEVKGDNMKPEKNYVMKFGSIGEDSIWYRVPCSCTDLQCDMTLEIEFDKDVNSVVLNMYKRLRASAHWGYTSNWGWFDFIRVFINKLSMCCKMLVFGYVDVEEGFMIREEKHIDDFIKALEEGKTFIKWVNRDRKE